MKTEGNKDTLYDNTSTIIKNIRIINIMTKFKSLLLYLIGTPVIKAEDFFIIINLLYIYEQYATISTRINTDVAPEKQINMNTFLDALNIHLTLMIYGLVLTTDDVSLNKFKIKIKDIIDINALEIYEYHVKDKIAFYDVNALKASFTHHATMNDITTDLLHTLTA